MECLNCDDGKTIVIDSIKYAGTVLRKRKCQLCSSVVWTEELEVEDLDTVREALSYKQRKYRANKKGVKI